MRRTPAVAHAAHVHHIPSGWIVLGAALASWMVVALLWAGASQVFSLIVSAV